MKHIVKFAYWFKCFTSLHYLANEQQEHSARLMWLEQENEQLISQNIELQKAIDWLVEREMVHH